MSHTTITRVASGRQVLDYVLDEKGHNNNAVRNQLVIAVNMSPGDISDYYAQMNAHWQQRSGKQKYDVNHIISSFSDKELPRDDPRSAYLAAHIAQEFHDKMYSGHQAVIAVQRDGKGGYWHVHIVESCTDMFTHKGCNNEQTWDGTIRREMDAVISKYMDIDHGMQGGSRNKQSILEKRDRGEYVWKDDLAQRVLTAQAQATGFEDFKAKLKENGVEIKTETKKGEPKVSKKYGAYYTYVLTDTSRFGADDKIPKKAMSARSFHLDADYEGNFGPTMTYGKAPQAENETPAPEPEPAPEPAPAPAQTSTVVMQHEDPEVVARREEEALLFADWMAENGREYSDETFFDDMDDFKADAAFHARVKAEKEAKAKAEAEAKAAAIKQEDAAAAAAAMPVVHQTETPDDEKERRERAAALKQEAEERRKRDAGQFAEDATEELAQAVSDALQKAQDAEKQTYKPDDEDYYS